MPSQEPFTPNPGAWKTGFPDGAIVPRAGFSACPERVVLVSLLKCGGGWFALIMLATESSNCGA